MSWELKPRFDTCIGENMEWAISGCAALLLKFVALRANNMLTSFIAERPLIQHNCDAKQLQVMHAST